MLIAKQQKDLIKRTQELAAEAAARGDGPFAALLVDERGEIVESATNTTRTSNNSTAHAEINLIGSANQTLGQDLSKYSVVTNAAPCSMCMSALIKAKVQDYYYGAPIESHTDPKITPEEISAKSSLEISIVGGILAQSCAEQIAQLREKLAKLA